MNRVICSSRKIYRENEAMQHIVRRQKWHYHA